MKYTVVQKFVTFGAVALTTFAIASPVPGNDKGSSATASPNVLTSPISLPNVNPVCDGPGAIFCRYCRCEYGTGRVIDCKRLTNIDFFKTKELNNAAANLWCVKGNKDPNAYEEGGGCHCPKATSELLKGKHAAGYIEAAKAASASAQQP